MGRSLKIVMTIPWFTPNRGGAENGAYELARQLIQRGHEVHVLTPRYKREWAADENIDGVRVHRFWTLGVPGLPRLSELLHSLWPFCSVPALIRKIRPDVVHLHYVLFTGHAALRAAKRQRIPTVLTLVGNDIYDPFYEPAAFLFRYNKHVIHNADRVIAACRFIKEKIVGKFGLPADRAVIVPYGVDPDRFASLPVSKEAVLEKYGVPAGASVVLTVQRLHERKEIPVFIRAAQRVLTERPRTVFLIAGKGPEETKLKSLVRELGLQKSVRILGFVPDADLPALYGIADLFAFHTVHEGFGIVVLEAMSCRVPVVTTKAGGTEDVVNPGVTGRLVAPRQPEELARAIVDMLSEPLTSKQMGEAGRARVEQFFSWPRIADQYEQIYQQLQKTRK